MPILQRSPPGDMTEWRVAEVVGRLPQASNATLLGRLEDGTLVVYKPIKGEQPLWDFGPGTLAAREALTFEVSEALGFGLVPETVIGDGPFGAGSIQRFIEEDPEFNPAPLINEADPSLWPVAVLDILINNADRKAGHLIGDARDGRLWCIDHGISLHDEPKLRTVLWNFAGAALPNEMVRAAERFLEALRNGLTERVADLLSEQEAAALVSRTRALLSTPRHPEPPDDRPALPWPVW